MKVYVIEAGCYSDRHIVAVASEMEVAEAIKEKVDRIYGGDEADITEYETDVYVPLLNKRLFSVSTWRGKLIANETDNFDLLNPEDGVKRVSEVWYVKHLERMFVNVLAKDEANALKIAQDLFAEYKAKKEGVAI